MTYQNLFFRVPSHGKSEKVPESLKGYFLMSENNMLDANFFQTVVLMLEHNRDGAFGLIVNRRSNFTLKALSTQDAPMRSDDLYVYMGGPVQQEYLFVLHSEMPEGHQSSADAIQPMDRVIFEPSFTHLEKYFEDAYWNSIPADDRPQMHLFLGYSGWASGQLEKEIEIGSWIFHPAHSEIVFHEEPDKGWRDALRAKGGIYKVFANSQQDPCLN